MAIVAHCVVISESGRVLRSRRVTTFEEVLATHRELPRRDIAVFEEKDGKGGAMWAFFPDMEAKR